MKIQNARGLVDKFLILEKAEDFLNSKEVKNGVFTVKTYLTIFSFSLLFVLNELFFEDSYLSLIEPDFLASTVGFINVVLAVCGFIGLFGCFNMVFDAKNSVKLVSSFDNYVKTKFKNEIEHKLFFSILGKELKDYKNFDEMKEDVVEKKEEISKMMLKRDFIISLKKEIEDDFIENKNYTDFLSKLLEVFNKEKVSQRIMISKLNDQLKEAGAPNLKTDVNSKEFQIIEGDV